MQGYRSGDEVSFITSAVVVDEEPKGVLIQFGDTTIHVARESLHIVRRAIHEGDAVLHRDRRAKVVQRLEANVFLVHIAGQIGPQAYAIAGIGELEHDDEEQTQAFEPAPAPAPAPSPAPQPAPQPAPEPVPALDDVPPPAPVVEAPPVVPSLPEPAPETAQPQPDATSADQTTGGDATPPADPVGDDDTLELDQRVDETRQGQTDDVGDMANALAGLIRRRNGPADLESLGETQEVKAVGAGEDRR